MLQAIALILSATDDATGSNARVTGLAVLAASTIAASVAALSGPFRSLTTIP